MEDGIFPSYMSIAAEDPLEMEEERRLCYVGITRAKEELYLTSARQRMVRGEVHYNRVSRFIDEIPEEYLATEERVKEQPRQKVVQRPYQQAREAFRSKAFVPQQFQVKKAAALDYAVGDRVRHIKFGEGCVTQITDGGRDYEVTVDFDRVGVKKMFASFAKLIKTN
jgi:DNA helicase-2/ATP-dependent DNA helicase PcrA